MKVLIDTNILISAVLNPKGKPATAFYKAVNPPNKGVICDQNVEELRRIIYRKFPLKIEDFEKFFVYSMSVMDVISVPEKEFYLEHQIRDIMDRPILRAAMSAGADILLTGDKDFLESQIENPKIMTAVEFIKQ